MTFTKDSPLVSSVHPTASGEQGPRPGGAGDIKGIAIHMAQGGGTVGWLDNPDGNSSHYVVEYDGDIVQMVRETHWAGSIKPSLIRLNNDPAYAYLGESITYGRAAALSALGSAAANDPNQYVIAIEVEGFAGTAPTVGKSGYDARANPTGGPNAKQRDSLARLVADIRRRRGALACLGHRDFQSYKACPGKRIPWVDYGGHAIRVATAPTSEDNVQSFTLLPGPDGTITVKADAPHAYLRLRDGALIQMTPAGIGTKRAIPVKLLVPIPGGAAGVDRATGYLIGDEAAFVLATDVTFTADPVVDCTPTQTALDAANVKLGKVREAVA